MSIVLILVGMAVGGWAVDTLQGDKKVIEDIDSHFKTLKKERPQGETTATSVLSESEADETPDVQTRHSSKKKSAKHRGGAETKKSASAAQPIINEAEGWPGIHNVAPLTYTIDEHVFDAAKSNTAQLIKGVRSVLVAKNGTPVGFQLFGISSQSALFAVGLRNGDILTSVNGYTLGTIDKALLAVAALKTARQFRVDLIRGDGNVSLYYRVM
jgi:type II secretory pathway component PulC